MPRKKGVERDEVIQRAEELGWVVEPPAGKRGYRYKLKCPCGAHITWISKTPSNPHYWFERLKYIERVCDGPRT